ncbi:MAG: hypothetical protein ACJAZK_002092 [Psychroserpens sp.]|jgi:hypothetical protein
MPFDFDLDLMRQEYNALQLKDFEYYNIIQLRGITHIIDP